MLFDVQAALAEIMADTSATIATPATNRVNVAEVANVAAGPCEISAPATPSSGAVALPFHSPARPSVPSNMVRLDPDNPPSPRAARLPTHPPSCAICGMAEWTVAMTDRRGRKVHVSCWKREA